MAQLSTNMIPKWIGSIPAISTIDIGIGVSTRMVGVGSITMPTTSTIAMMTSIKGFGGAAPSEVLTVVVNTAC